MFFKDEISSIDELRNQYKKLLIKYHPDNNLVKDTTKILQEINSEYDTLLKKFKNITSNTSTDFSEETLKNVLNELAKICNVEITIEIIGSWIWVTGNTYTIKKKLKELGFKWASKKSSWYWGTSTHKSTKQMDMSFIKEKYGCTVYNTHTDEKQAIEA